MPLIINTPITIKSEEKTVIETPTAPVIEPRKAISDTLMIKKVVKEQPKKTVRHSDFMMDMTISDNL